MNLQIKLSKGLVANLMISIFVISLPQKVSSKSIQWFNINLTPTHTITHGEFEGQGTTDLLAKLFKKELVSYKQTNIVVGIPRLLATMKVKSNICNPSLKVTSERQKIAYFTSHASIIRPAIGFAVRRDDKRFPKIAKSFPLNKIKTSKEIFTLGIENKRSYGKVIDSIITKIPEKRIYRRSSKNNYKALVRMLISKRIDAVLGYPQEFSFYGKELKALEKIRFIPISETKPFTLSNIACSKTPEGKKIIQDLNDLLLKLRPTKAYRDILEKWLNPEILSDFRKAYNSEFLSN